MVKSRTKNTFASNKKSFFSLAKLAKDFSMRIVWLDGATITPKILFQVDMNSFVVKLCFIDVQFGNKTI